MLVVVTVCATICYTWCILINLWGSNLQDTTIYKLQVLSLSSLNSFVYLRYSLCSFIVCLLIIPDIDENEVLKSSYRT